VAGWSGWHEHDSEIREAGMTIQSGWMDTFGVDDDKRGHGSANVTMRSVKRG
jgi:hypothetical protein